MILPDYLTYLNFGVNIAMIVAHICCIIPMSYLIYCSRLNRRVLKVKSLSATLYTFIIVHAIGAAAVLPYHVYLLVKWQHGTNGSYDPYLLLLLGMWEPVYFGLSSVSTFILTLDRCLGLQFPLRFNTISKVFVPLSVVCHVILGLLFLCGSLVEIPVDIVKTSNCQTYNCVSYKYENKVTGFTRLAFAVLNTILLCHFLCALRKTGNDRVNDILIKVTLFVEIALTTVPLLVARMFAFVTGFSSANYIGETLVLMYSLNSAICAIYYYKILLKSSSEKLLFVSRTTATSVIPARDLLANTKL